MGKQHGQQQIRAKSPYNFIPLNKYIIPSPINISKIQEGSLNIVGNHDPDRISGYIDLNIETKTDLFIRCRDAEGLSINSHPAIPGSSLRGMVRNLVEVIGWGKLKFANRKLYYRNMSFSFYRGLFTEPIKFEPSLNLEATGFNNMFKEANGIDSVRIKEAAKSKTKAGYLCKEGNRYFIVPAQLNSLGYSYLRVYGNARNIKSEGEKPYYKYTIGGVEYDPLSTDFNYVAYNSSNIELLYKKHIDKKTGSINYIEYPFVKEFNILNWSQNANGVLIYTGAFATKKQFHWVVNNPNTTIEVLNVPDEVIHGYKEDVTRKVGELYNIVDRANQEPSLPCFYLQDESAKVLAIGHTGFFRVPYANDINDLVKQEFIGPGNMRKNYIDFPTTIFGNEQSPHSFSGRVQFTDAIHYGELKIREEKQLDILSSPKPTSFKMYLEQKNRHSQQNWNDKTQIRGHKFYWHTSANRVVRNYKATIDKESAVLSNPIKPIKPSNTFKCRIYYTNLFPEELGLLAMAINLDDTCWHKLGIGKPYGLGSIKITPTYYQYKETYYEPIHLFDRSDLRLSQSVERFDPIKSIEIFKNYVKDVIGERNLTSWETTWKAVIHIHNANNNFNEEDLDYMDVGDFKNATALPNWNEY